MKKVIGFSSIVLILFIALAFLTTQQQKNKIEKYSLYNKDDLAPETIALLDNPNYQDLILPEKLEEKIKNKETFTLYFYSSDCIYCMEATPNLVSLSKELNIDIPQFNLMEFPEGWEQYNIKYTPTLVQYVDGVEINRVIGLLSKEEYKKWLEENSL